MIRKSLLSPVVGTTAPGSAARTEPSVATSAARLLARREVLKLGMLLSASPIALLRPAYGADEPDPHTPERALPTQAAQHILEYGGEIALHLGQAGAAHTGTYVGGRQFVVIDADLRVTATTPPSRQVRDHNSGALVWQSGMEKIETLDHLTSGRGQVFHGFDEHQYGGSGASYGHDRNIDPGATGAALEITRPCVLIKANTGPRTHGPNGRSPQHQMAAVHFVASIPPEGALPPPIGAPAQISRYLRDDIDFSVLPRLSAIPGAEDPEELYERVQRFNHMQMRGRPRGEAFTNASSIFHGYGSNAAARTVSAQYAMCCDLGGREEDFAIQFVIMAQDILEAAKAGMRFNPNRGLGGLWPGYKLILLIGAKLTQDAEMYAYADPQAHPIWAEDTQTLYITQDIIDMPGTDFIQADLGMPEYIQNSQRALNSASRKTSAGYRGVFRRHQFGQSAIAHILGLTEAWKNDAFFDYCDRCARGRFFSDSDAVTEYWLTVGRANFPSEFHQDLYNTYVSPRWSWPA